MAFAGLSLRVGDFREHVIDLLLAASTHQRVQPTHQSYGVISLPELPDVARFPVAFLSLEWPVNSSANKTDNFLKHIEIRIGSLHNRIVESRMVVIHAE